MGLQDTPCLLGLRREQENKTLNPKPPTFLPEAMMLQSGRKSFAVGPAEIAEKQRHFRGLGRQSFGSRLMRGPYIYNIEANIRC